MDIKRSNPIVGGLERTNDMRYFLFTITLYATALVSTMTVANDDYRLNAGPLTLDLYISRTANLFHAVDQIAQWSEFCHTQYVPYFQGLAGGISQEDHDLLAQHCAIRRVHGWGGGLEQTFYTSDDLETALARGVQEGHLSQEEAQQERRILTHFQERVERLMTAEASTLKRFVQQLQARKPDLVTFANDISRFVGGAQITVPVFLITNPDEYTCGGGVNGGRLTIEIGRSCDAYPILLHELFHAFVQTKQELIQRAARAVPGLNVETLGEGLAHAYSPGLFPAANPDQTDQLSTMVAGFKAQGLSLQDARTRFRFYGLALRPLLKDALSDKRQTLETFLPRATDAWLVLTELEKARDTKSASQTHDYRKDPRHSIFVFGTGDQEASDMLLRTSHRHFWGRDHVADQYQDMLTRNAKPGDTIILLLSLGSRGRVPDEFSDLLPLPWPQVESLLRQGQTVFRRGQARDMDVFLLATPTTETLRQEFRRRITEGEFVPDAGAKPK
jgi:hypothetical protein